MGLDMRALLSLLAVSLAAQVSSVVTLSNGVRVNIAANSARGAAASLKPELAPASGNSFYRIFRDQNGLTVFAYEVQVERTADGERFRVIARPAGADFAARFPNADAGKPTPTLAAPRESPLLGSGGKFAIEIPTDPALGNDLTDTVQIEISRRGGVAAAPEEQSAARLRFSGLRVSVDGRPVTPSGGAAVVAGRFVMFYIPGQGGYFFSAEPVDGRPFVQAATVDGKRLRFTLDNVTYECNTDTQILIGSERGQIWVYHDANYRPAGNWTKSNPKDERRDEFFTAGSDSLQWWLQ